MEHKHTYMRAVGPEDLAQLEALAREDGHEAVRPTHVFVRIAEDRSEELIGCVSLGVMPTVLPWFHTERCKARDSLFLIDVMENVLAELMRRTGQEYICVPVAKGSPFEKVMGRLGYASAGEFSLQLKKVR